MRRKTSQERKVMIINVARDLVIREGVQALTIKNLSRKNKISEPAVYRHFKNKRAILAALIDDLEHNLMEAIDAPVRIYKNPLERLREIMKAHMVFTEKKKGVLFGITAESIHFNDDFLRRKILGVIEKYKSKIREILLDAKREGFLREDINLDAVGLTFFGLIQAAIVQYALTNYSVPPITKFNTLWNVFLRGIEQKAKK
ncbi:MAG: TetR/AcrR family transcriptional regulator [Candidatus Susulua stagnicola]|nr:TetR/AcrR family transcriptional regulator [Candidatus Susulua stagnicola]